MDGNGLIEGASVAFLLARMEADPTADPRERVFLPDHIQAPSKSP